MSYYSGGRRYALGGKGWTLVLGTTVSLSYIRARAKMYDEDNSQSYHKALKNEKGETLTFHDQTTPAGPQEDIVIRMWRELPDLPLPNLYAVGGLLTAFWAYRMHGTFDRLMIVRFADVGYQLRRPDVLANKVLALKYLALPLAVIPVGALGCFFFLSGHPDGRFPGRGFQSYGQWWQAHQNIQGDVPLLDKPVKSTNFWPYGQGMSTLTCCPKDESVYKLDTLVLRNCVPDKPSPGSAGARSMFRVASSPVLTSAGSGAVLLGYAQERKNRHR